MKEASRAGTRGKFLSTHVHREHMGLTRTRVLGSGTLIRMITLVRRRPRLPGYDCCDADC